MHGLEFRMILLRWFPMHAQAVCVTTKTVTVFSLTLERISVQKKSSVVTGSRFQNVRTLNWKSTVCHKKFCRILKRVSTLTWSWFRLVTALLTAAALSSFLCNTQLIHDLVVYSSWPSIFQCQPLCGGSTFLETVGFLCLPFKAVNEACISQRAVKRLRRFQLPLGP